MDPAARARAVTTAGTLALLVAAAGLWLAGRPLLAGVLGAGLALPLVRWGLPWWAGTAARRLPPLRHDDGVFRLRYPDGWRAERRDGDHYQRLDLLGREVFAQVYLFPPGGEQVEPARVLELLTTGLRRRFRVWAEEPLEARLEGLEAGGLRLTLQRGWIGGGVASCLVARRPEGGLLAVLAFRAFPVPAALLEGFLGGLAAPLPGEASPGGA